MDTRHCAMSTGPVITTWAGNRIALIRDPLSFSPTAALCAVRAKESGVTEVSDAAKRCWPPSSVLKGHDHRFYRVIWPFPFGLI